MYLLLIFFARLNLNLKFLSTITIILLIIQRSTHLSSAPLSLDSFDQNTFIPRANVYEMLRDPDHAKAYYAASYILTYQIDKNINQKLCITGTFTFSARSHRLHNVHIPSFEQHCIAGTFVLNATPPLHNVHIPSYEQQIKDLDLAYSTFSAMARDINCPLAYDAASQLWNSDRENKSEDDKALGRAAFRAMAQNLNHPNAYAATMRLWDSTVDEDKEIAHMALTALAQHQNDFDAAMQLWHSSILTDKEKALSVLRIIAKDLNHARAYESISHLWCLDIENDRQFLRMLFQDIGNPKIYSIALELWNEGGDTTKELARTPLCAIAQTINHLNAYNAAALLYDSTVPQDKEIGLSTIRKVVRNLEHPNAYDAAIKLRKIVEENRGCIACAYNVVNYWWSTNTEEVDDLSIVRSTLYSIAKKFIHNPKYQNAGNALNQLLATKNEKDDILAFPILRAIIQNPNHSSFFDATRILFFSGKLENKTIARPILHGISQNLNHPDSFNAAEILWGSDEREDNTVAFEVLRTIAATLHQDDIRKNRQKKAIQLLRAGKYSNAQLIGLQYLLEYFPPTLDAETTAKQGQFNREEIRSVMPKSLADLSADPMDLVAEFEHLLSLLSTDETSPHYISPQAIAGSQILFSSQFYTTLRNQTMGFIKALVNVPLSSFEVSGWQMYDENKPKMINSLKHLIKAIKGKLASDNLADIQTAMNSFGIILNALTYCPTGQAEGIQSAVNMLIHGRNTTTTNVHELVGTSVVASAVQKAFYNAFSHMDPVHGNVHNLAIARLVLSHELGMTHALDGFKERIARVTDAEIPQIFNAFYKHFTPSFVLAEAKRNIQTAEEYDKIINAKTAEDRERESLVKKEKPISVGEITAWLNDHASATRLNGEENKDEGIDFEATYGIPDTFDSISDSGIIMMLIQMDYLTDCRKNWECFSTLRSHEMYETR